MTRKIIFLVLVFSSPSFSQVGFSPFIDSVKNLCTNNTLRLLERQLSGDTSCIINGSEYTIASRYWGNIGNQMAAQFIYEKFVSFGLETGFMDFSPTGRNVFAVKRGSKYPNRKYIICSHYDDMPTGSPAPGADDNASGTCAVLEAARLIAHLQTDYSILFIAFDEEERGALGSQAYCDSVYSAGDTILFAFDYDMIAWDGNNDGVLNLIANSSSTSHTDGVAAAFNVYSQQITPIKIIGNSWSGSDNWSFWTQGFKAMCGIENLNDFNPNLHTSNDRFQTLNFPYFHEFTQAAIAAILSFALDCFIELTHSPIYSNNNTGPRTALVKLNSTLPPAYGNNSPRLYYRVNSGPFSYVNPFYSGHDTLLFQIPGESEGSMIQYYIAAQDSLGRSVATLPKGGRGVSPPGSIPPPDLYSYYVLTGISGSSEPTIFSLGQNYPNPFNSSTQIIIQLPRAMFTKMIVFDLLGRTVQTPVNGFLPSGENIVLINAADLASGTYIYTLFTDGEFAGARRMILSK